VGHGIKLLPADLLDRDVPFFGQFDEGSAGFRLQRAAQDQQMDLALVRA